MNQENRKLNLNFIKKTVKISLYGLYGLIGISSSLASNKIIDNLNQEELFIYHGNLKLTNSKLNNAEIQGSNHLYNNDFIGYVSINGNTDLKENNFTKELNIMGDIKSENNKYINKLVINGNFKDKSSHFLADIRITGKANFEESELISNIDIDSNDIKFIESKANNIIFSNKEDLRIINLYLTKNTKIAGDIVFSNNKGKVHTDKTVVIEGNVTGGEIVLDK